MNDALGIYLKDQYALGVAWRELAKRAAGKNKGTELGAALEVVATGITEDVATFHDIMRRLSVAADPVKVGLVRLAERVSRVKLNGRIRGYSPLSRFEELEFLTMGIDGKAQMWTTLRDLAGLRTRLPDVDFDELIARARAQHAELEPHREAAGRKAFATASRDV